MRGVLLLVAVFAAILSAQPADFPMVTVLSPEHKFVLVLGAGTPGSIRVLDASMPQQEVSRVALPDAWFGLTFALGGKKVFAGGAARGSIYELDFSPAGQLTFSREIKASGFIGDVAVSPDGRLIYAADLFGNLILVINPQSGRVIDRFKTGRRPYRILFHPDGKAYFVSSWADAAVYEYDLTGQEIGRIRLGSHATDMALSAFVPSAEEGTSPAKYRLFVTASNTNSVFAVGIGENKTLKLLETIDIAATEPGTISPLGMTPSALALSPDQKTLFVACSDANAVASVDVSEAHADLQGFIPAGSYPTAMVASSEKSLVLANGRDHAVSSVSAETFQALPVATSTTPPPSDVEHVLYFVPSSDPETLMRAIAGIAPDFTVKLGRRPEFNIADPANLPPAGYLWTNTLAAGKTVQNYGVFVRGGQAIDIAVRPFTEPDSKSFLADLKEGEASGDMPNLILMDANDPLRQAAIDAVMKSRFGSKTKIVENGNIGAVEDYLGLRPMTRRDAMRP